MFLGQHARRSCFPCLSATTWAQPGKDASTYHRWLSRLQGSIGTIVLIESSHIEHRLLALILWSYACALLNFVTFQGFSMLSRGNSSAGNRLRRAKSASSVQNYRPASVDAPSQDPELAYRHALTAASVAFEHAHGRAVKRAPAEVDDVLTPEGEGLLKHRRSIRFTGPSALSVNQRSTIRRSTADRNASARKLHSTQSQGSLREPSLRTSDSFTTALGDQNDDYVERRVSSVPSSYRKLRKSKSMVNTSKSPGLSLVNSFSKRAGPSHNHSQGHSQQRIDHRRRASTESRLRKSFSFLRPPTLSPNPSDAPVDQDKAVQIARDQFVRQLEQQRLKEKTSVVDFAQSRRTAKPFKRTVRTSSTNSYGSAIASPAAAAGAKEVSKTAGFGRKARSISNSLKSKLKRAFQKSSEPEDMVPNQHLNASRAHFGDYASTFNGIQQRYDYHIPSPDTDTIRRIDSRSQTFRETSAFVEKKSHPASVRSVESDQSAEDDPSRVSSWDNSTIANSLATLQLRENKRLSTINEHGAPYQPSSVRSYGHLAHRFAADDSIRDFSAGSLYTRLRREIEKNERQARNEEGVTAFEHHRAKDLKHIADLTPRDSSLTSHGQGLRMSKSVIFDPAATNSKKQPSHTHNNHEKKEAFGVRSLETARESPERTDSLGSTPKRPLREVKSAFFPPTTRIERSGTSPYRQAMRSSTDVGPSVEHDMHMPNETKNHLTGIPQSGYLGVKNATDSDSIYSRTTSGNTPRASDSPSSDSHSDGGTAVVALRPLKYDHSSSPSRNKNASSTQSSGDWKKWLSSEVAQMETQGNSSFTGRSMLLSNAPGHKREKAQLNDDDVEIGRLSEPDCTRKQPVAEVQANARLRPTQNSKDTSDSMVERYPLVEIGTPHAPTPGQSWAISPGEIPPRSWSQNQAHQGSNSPQSAHTLKSTKDLRPKASQASLNNSLRNTTNQKRHGMNLLPMSSTSQETLRTPSPRNAINTKSSENLGSRYSAEREARLRRMQSSGSLNSKHQQENRPPFSSGGSGEKKRPPLIATRSAGSISPKEGSQLMIERFLTHRRRDMRISEESGGDAFL